MEMMEDLSRAVKQLQDNVQCPICFDILVDPVSTKCNHHFCSTCHKKLFLSRGKLSCPVCHTPLTRRSYAKSSISLNPIVEAIRSLMECLVEDTGIDFTKEATVPVSSREAHDISQTDDCPKIYALQINKQGNKNLSEKHPGNKQADTDPDRKVDKTNNVPIHRRDRYSRQYSGKKQAIKPDDSFRFPADFIAGSCKKNTEETKLPSSQLRGNKVYSWLKNNEKNLNSFEDVSILNGSLPKKISPDLNISFSDDELLSVSQVKASSNLFLPAKKIESEIVLDTLFEEPEFKDPYEFVSSQKTNASKHLIKTAKRVRKSYVNKKKPLGLDISRLVNEYAKKRKLNDTTFQAPVVMNDTFDQLISTVQKPQVDSVGNAIKKSTSNKNDKESEDDEIFIFRSQNKPSCSSEESLLDISSGSGEEWGQTRQEEMKQNFGRTRERVFKERKTNEKGGRKSDSINKSKRVKKDMLDKLNKSFEEIEKFKLVTSSQVMREKLLNDSTSNADNGVKAVDVLCLSENCANETNKIENECYVKSNHRDISHSPGWSRVNKFKNELASNKKTKPNSIVNKVKVSESKSTCDNLENSDTLLKKIEGKKSIVKFHGNEGLAEKETSKEIRSEFTSSLNRNSSSPEEPIRYLNLSQSQERAKIMNEVVRSLEQSLKKSKEVGVSGVANMYVSLDDFSDELELMSTCGEMNNKSKNEELVMTGSKTYSPLVDMSEKILEHSQKQVDEVALKRPLSVLNKEPVINNEKNANSDENQRSDTKQVSEDVDHRSSFPQEESTENQYVPRDQVVYKHLSSPVNHTQENLSGCKEHNGPKTGDKVGPKKEILTNVSKEDITNILDDKSAMKQSRKTEQLIRKVRFLDVPNAETSENVAESDTSGCCVVFLKVGNFSDISHIPKIKFWFLGTCMTESERQDEVTQWIIKVSKSAPICQCGNVKFEGISKTQTLNSSIEQGESEKNVPMSQIKENKVDAMTQTSSFSPIDPLIGKNMDSSPPECIQDDMEMDNNHVEQTLQKSVTVTSLLGVRKEVVINSKDCVISSENDHNSKTVGIKSQNKILSQEETTGKLSDEDIFNSGQKSDDGPLKSKNKNKFDKDFYDKLPSSSSSCEMMYEILPQNKVVEVNRNCCPTGDDIFISCLDNNELLQEAIPEHVRKNVSQDSFKSLEEGSDKNTKDKENSHKICEGVLNTNTDVFAELNHCPLLPQDYKSESLSDSENVLGGVGNRLNTERDIFASGSNQSVQGHVSNEVPEIVMSNKKCVRTLSLSSSSDDNDSNGKRLKKSCVVAGIATLKENNNPRNLRSSVSFITKNDEDEDDLLNSEELLQKVMDNINEDLGYNKPIVPKLKGARKRILSDSEDETEDLAMNYKKLSKSPEYENQKNYLEEDIFKDVDNDKDIIEESPKKIVSDSFNKGKDLTENKYLSEKGQNVNISQDPSSKFILPHSSYAKKLNLTPKSALTPKAGNIKNINAKSTELGNVFESVYKTNNVNVERNTPKGQEKSSPKIMSTLRKSENKSEGCISSAAKKTENAKKPLFVCSGLPPGVIAKVKNFAQICGAGFSDNFCIGMTHLIVSVDENRSTPKTLKYLKAVAAKKWIVSYDWIVACVSAHKLLPEDEYEAIDKLGVDGPRKSRLSSGSLFKDVQVCFIEPFNSITLDELQDLFMMCGGMIVDSPEAFSVSKRDVIRILVSDMEDENTESTCQKWLIKHRAVAVISDWVLDSIGTYTFQPLPAYFVGSYSNDQLQACGIPEKLLYVEDLESTAVSE